MFTFSQEELDKCLIFSRSQNNNYGRRNQTNPGAIQRQVYVGKLGEIVAHTHLQPEFDTINEPDFEIYKAKQKSWKPDLSCEGFDFHVKCQSVEEAVKYGLSWTFQFSDNSGRGGRDVEIFNEKGVQTSFVIFVSVDLKRNFGTVHGIISANRLAKQNLFRDPKLAHLKGIKKVVYFSDLEAAGLSGASDHISL